MQHRIGMGQSVPAGRRFVARSGRNCEHDQRWAYYIILWPIRLYLLLTLLCNSGGKPITPTGDHSEPYTNGNAAHENGHSNGKSVVDGATKHEVSLINPNTLILIIANCWFPLSPPRIGITTARQLAKRQVAVERRRQCGDQDERRSRANRHGGADANLQSGGARAAVGHTRSRRR